MRVVPGIPLGALSELPMTFHSDLLLAVSLAAELETPPAQVSPWGISLPPSISPC